jgi:hypothetical protein
MIATKSTVALSPPRPGRQREAAGTLVLGVLAVASTSAVAAIELARARNPQLGKHTVSANSITTMAPAAITRDLTHTQSALLGMLGSFATSLVGVRVLAHVIRRHGRLGPFGNLMIHSRHIHHFVPGIVVGFSAGAGAILSPQRRSALKMAVPFGAGLALTVDEFALLLDLEDVYWSAEGKISVQIALGLLGGLSTAALALRLLARAGTEWTPLLGRLAVGERRVLVCGDHLLSGVGPHDLLASRPDAHNPYGSASLLGDEL